MLDARDAMVAADLIQFPRASQDLLWNTFASRGFGQNAASTGPNDVDQVPEASRRPRQGGACSSRPVSRRRGRGRAAVRRSLRGSDDTVADTDPATSSTPD